MIPTKRSDDRVLSTPIHFTESGVQNTDQQMADLAYEALRATGYCQLRHLHLYFEHGRVTLQGHLPTYYLKQVAQTAILDVDGVREIDNDVTVSG